MLGTNTPGWLSAAAPVPALGGLGLGALALGLLWLTGHQTLRRRARADA